MVAVRPDGGRRSRRARRQQPRWRARRRQRRLLYCELHHPCTYCTASSTTAVASCWQGPGPGIKKQTKAGARSTSQLLLYFLLTTSAEIGAPRASRQRSRFTEGCFFSPAATRAGELRAEEQQLAQEQARWELEDELQVEARRELQLQALETQARAGPGRREGIAAAQALGGGRG
ncbi:uncharacterized protein LOC119362052 [Triticum dicoccoides]|uniref:uncharacterized protein LOC119362052 n=1 Tax=Triticum dicoccoides TaxID=85692 RepID=UPI001890A5F0|nr:uncharacterized protein LOC119362052 [Triticum dicoccoides]XP_044367211.1 uncharacterized protein LOC123089651 [Triticum aestivum]